MTRYILWFLYAAVPATLVLGVAYAVIEQNYREGLNDPQIQMAEDGASALSRGAAPAEVMPLTVGQPGARTPTIDASQSLSVWIAIFDASGTPLESSATIADNPLVLPNGVFNTSSWVKHGNGTYFNQGPVAETRFTWQPEAGVREAVVLVETPDKKYFVASGRNMREVEQRIEHEGEIIFVGWVVTMLAIAMLQLLYVFGGSIARHRAR
jgi:hypothetical protein